jgi:hypothetical protein
MRENGHKQAFTRKNPFACSERRLKTNPLKEFIAI